MISTFFALLVPISWVVMVSGGVGFAYNLFIALTETGDKGEAGLLIFGIVAVVGGACIIGFLFLGFIAKVMETAHSVTPMQANARARRRGRLRR